jgi:hypothetical protein
MPVRDGARCQYSSLVEPFDAPRGSFRASAICRSSTLPNPRGRTGPALFIGRLPHPDDGFGKGGNGVPPFDSSSAASLLDLVGVVAERLARARLSLIWLRALCRMKQEHCWALKARPVKLV